MVDFSQEEQKIAKLLLAHPKTAEELRKESSLTLPQVNEALKKLIKLRLVERTEDEKYKLVSIVEQGVRGKSAGEVIDNYRVKLTIEALSQSKEALEKQMELLESKLRSERVRVHSLERASAEQQGENFTSFISLDCSATSFSDVINLIINYGPSSIELVKPKEVRLSLSEAQEALNEVASAVHYYISLILSLKYAELMQKKTKSQDE
ncbi:MAG: hypothetical protein QXO69_01195 [archaeon]